MASKRKKGLNEKQRAFVEHYLICWNASEAARRAGYSGKNANVIGPRMLANVGIKAEIEARLSKMTLSANEVLARLTAHATGSLEPFLSIDQDGYGHFDLGTEQAKTALHLVKKVKFRTTVRGEGDDAVMTTEEEIEIHDPQTALVHLGRYHKLFGSQDTALNIDVSKLTDEQVERIANGENPLRVIADASPGGEGAQASRTISKAETANA